MTTCPIITKPTDLHLPGAIDQLIAFHRQTFGGWTMEDEDEAAKAAAAAAEAAKTREAEELAAKEKAEAEKLGFPPKTKVEDMTVEQQAAYHRHQARKHEDRNKDWQRLMGDKTPEQIKAEQDELEKLRAKDRTDAENAVADAKKTTTSEVTLKFAAKLAAAEFKAVLTHVDEDRRKLIIEGLDLTKFVDDNGDVDTDKVKSTAAALAPADTGAGEEKVKKKDFGAGRRQSGSSTGINSGQSRYQERHAKKKAEA